MTGRVVEMTNLKLILTPAVMAKIPCTLLKPT